MVLTKQEKIKRIDAVIDVLNSHLTSPYSAINNGIEDTYYVCNIYNELFYSADVKRNFKLEHDIPEICLIKNERYMLWLSDETLNMSENRLNKITLLEFLKLMIQDGIN